MSIDYDDYRFNPGYKDPIFVAIVMVLWWILCQSRENTLVSKDGFHPGSVAFIDLQMAYRMYSQNMQSGAAT